MFRGRHGDRVRSCTAARCSLRVCVCGGLRLLHRANQAPWTAHSGSELPLLLPSDCDDRHLPPRGTSASGPIPCTLTDDCNITGWRKVRGIPTRVRGVRCYIPIADLCSHEHDRTFVARLWPPPNLPPQPPPHLPPQPPPNLPPQLRTLCAAIFQRRSLDRTRRCVRLTLLTEARAAVD